MGLNYRVYEIVVVDDGSTDDTARIMREAFHMIQIRRPIQRKLKCREAIAVFESREHKVPITLICKKNGGKADALNMGINAAQYPYFLSMDADSVLQRDSLEKIVRPLLEDDSVIAVGGAVRPCNGARLEDGQVVAYHMPRKILSCMQVLEYDRSFLAARILFDKFNGSIIISGAFGLFKKSMVIDVGGYDTKTMGEDMELVVKLHVFCNEHGIDYGIRYATDAVCWTQAPEKLSDLCKQRRRWQIGLYQSMTKHRRMLFNPKYGLVSYISYLYFLIYELLSPYIEVLGTFSMIMAASLGFLNVPFMLMYLGIYIIYASVMSLTAFFARVHTIDLRLTFIDAIKAIALCVLEVSGLRFVLAWVRMTALFGYRKKKTRWGQIERKKINFNSVGATSAVDKVNGR